MTLAQWNNLVSSSQTEPLRFNDSFTSKLGYTTAAVIPAAQGFKARSHTSLPMQISSVLHPSPLDLAVRIHRVMA